MHIGYVAATEGDSTQWYHNSMHGGSCILVAEAFYQVCYSLWFYSLLWILCKCVPASFTKLTTLQLTSVYHHAPLIVSYK